MCSKVAEPMVLAEEAVFSSDKRVIDINGIEFEKDGSVGIIVVHPPVDDTCVPYDPKLALEAIRDEIKGDESIRLVFLTGQGDRRSLLREIFEIDPRKNRRRAGRRKKRRARSKMKNARPYLTHTGSILPMLLNSGMRG